MKSLRRNLNNTAVEIIPIPRPSLHQSLVKIELAGICRTDIYAAQGKFSLKEPVTIGHEFCGTIVESVRFEEGTFVSAFPFVDCKTCPGCLARNESCDDKTMVGLGVDGAFAEYIVIDDCALFELPKSISKMRAAFLEPIAAALAPIAALKKREQQKGYLVGSGRIAALNAMVLNAHGFDQFSCGLGVDIKEASMDWVIEADATRINAALRLVRPGGILIAKSRPANLVNIDIALAVRKEITIRGVHYGRFEDAISLLENTALPLEELFGERFKLEDHEHAFSKGLGESKKLFFDPTL